MKRIKVKHLGNYALGIMLALAVADSSMALQRIDVSDARAHAVNISKDELTRIAVDGGKIRRIDSVEGELEIKKDDENGYLLVVPNVDKPINVFVSTDSGRTHSLILQPTSMPLETVILVEPKRGFRQDDGVHGQSGSFDNQIKNLIKAMATQDSDAGYDIQKMNVPINLWKNTTFTLVEKYRGAENFVGERYILMNLSQERLRVVEQELYKKKVIAVTIENLEIAPGDSSEIYIIRSE